MDWKSAIVRMLDRVDDERVLRRVWKILYRCWMG